MGDVLFRGSRAGNCVATILLRQTHSRSGIASPSSQWKGGSSEGHKTRGLAKMLRLAMAALQDKARQFMDLPPVTAKIIGSGSDLAIMDVTLEDRKRYLDKQPVNKLGGWINQTPARILLEIRFYNPIDTLKKFQHQQQQQDVSVDEAKGGIQVPVLLIGASSGNRPPGSSGRRSSR